MRLYLLIFCLFFNSFNIFSQINTVGEVTVNNFPEIECTFRHPNPEESSFSFFESIDGQEIKLDSFSINQINDTIDYAQKNKCVLVLWEYLTTNRKEQIETTRAAIKESLASCVNSGDKIRVYAFNLRKATESTLLRNVNNEFTDDISVLESAINDYDEKNSIFNNQNVSNIATAVQKAIKVLDQLNTDLPKSILVVSDFKKNREERKDLASIAKLAKEKGIIVDIIKYHNQGYTQFEGEELATETFGNALTLDVSNGSRIIHQQKKNQAKEFIISNMNSTAKRSAGTLYSASIFLENNLRDGKYRTLTIIESDGNYSSKETFKAPGSWMISQFQLNPILAIVATFFILLIIGILLYFLVKEYQKRKQIELEKKQDQQRVIKESQDQIVRQKQEIDDIKNQEEKRKQLEIDRLEEKNKKDRENLLIKQMIEDGGFPVLKYSCDGSNSQYEINNPNFSVGRDVSSNSIGINNKNISKNHFAIIFREKTYKIIDRNSTNGVIVNGKKVKESNLINGDIIEIGEATFIFYK